MAGGLLGGITGLLVGIGALAIPGIGPVVAGGALAALSLLTPHAWFLRGIENMAGGEGASAVVGPVLVMLAFAAVVGAVAFARAGRLIAR